jgi:hypothetical protein
VAYLTVFNVSTGVDDVKPIADPLHLTGDTTNIKQNTISPPKQIVRFYFFLPDPKLGCQPAVAPFWLGAAAMVLTFSFFGFFDSRLPLAMPAPWIGGRISHFRNGSAKGVSFTARVGLGRQLTWSFGASSDSSSCEAK